MSRLLESTFSRSLSAVCLVMSLGLVTIAGATAQPATSSPVAALAYDGPCLVRLPAGEATDTALV